MYDDLSTESKTAILTLQIASILTIVIGFIYALSIFTGKNESKLPGFVALAVAIVTAALLWGFAKIILLLIDIEYNTRANEKQTT